MSLEYFIDLDTLKIDMYRFSRILGILLDNSIEAARDCNKKLINVVFRKEEHKHRIVVIIENWFHLRNLIWVGFYVWFRTKFFL